MTSKTCTQCRIEKPIDAFYRKQSGRDERKSECAECSRERAHAWDRDNPEKRAALNRDFQEKNPTYAAEYYQNHKVEHGLVVNDWKRRNPEKVGEYAAKGADGHKAAKRAREALFPEEARLSRKRTREKRRDQDRSNARTWRANNKEKVRGYSAKRSAIKRSVLVDDVQLAIVWVRDGGICGICQLKTSRTNWHLDHIIPFARGGEHSYSNTRVSHQLCNLWKQDRLDSELPSIPVDIAMAAYAESLGGSLDA